MNATVTEEVPIQYEFTVDENYLRLVTAAELRRRFRNVFAYVRPALWLLLGLWAFTMFSGGARWAVVLVALAGVLLYRDTIGLYFSYPRTVAKNTPVGSVVGVGFGARTLAQRAAGVSTENSYSLVSVLIRHSGLLVLLYTDDLHTYYPETLIPMAEVDRINARLVDFHRGEGSQG